MNVVADQEMIERIAAQMPLAAWLLRYAMLRLDDGQGIRIPYDDIEMQRAADLLAAVGMLEPNNRALFLYRATDLGAYLARTLPPIDNENRVFFWRGEREYLSVLTRRLRPDEIPTFVPTHPLDMKLGDTFLRSHPMKRFQPVLLPPLRVNVIESDGFYVTLGTQHETEKGTRYTTDCIYRIDGAASPVLKVI